MIGTGTFLQQRYRIDKQIGQGGMGAVYVAMDERFGSVVAIKETLCMDENFRKALEREARLLNSLKHSALPRVSDHFLEDDGQFLVMEFVPGQDLMQTLETSGGPFPYEQVLTWADQLLDALDYLHTQENPVIHRDIKPQNLKVTSKGQVVLLDFGLAKGNVTDAGNLTAAKSIFGYSRNYASLEQIQGTGTDPRSDLYSLAATLYHLMTGIPPEDALTRAMAVLGQQPDPLRPATTVNPTIPLGVSYILQNAMDLTPGRRPSSALEMREMLRNHERYENLAAFPAIAAGALPTGASVFGAPTIANHDSTIAGGFGSEAATQLLPSNLSQVTSVRDPRSNGERVGFIVSDADAKPKRKRGFAIAGVIAVLAVCVGSVALYIDQMSASRQEESQAAPTSEQQQTMDRSAANVNSTEPSLSDSNTSSIANSPESPVVSQSERRANAPRVTVPNPPSTNSNPSDGAAGSNDATVVFDKDSMKAGNVKIEKGKIWMNGRELNINVPPPNVRLPDIPNVDMRYMTPEQRRRLRLLRQQHPEAFQRPSPTPRN
jgi:serine/threonine protein kinase